MNLTTKIFLTLQVISVMFFVLFFSKKSASETTTGYSDGGWTRHYTINVSGYKRAIRYGYTGITLSMVGWLYLIWGN